MSNSNERGLLDQLSEFLLQLAGILMISYWIVQGLFHTGDTPLTVLLMPIGLAITMGGLWLIVVASKILEAAFAAVKERWRRRQRGW